MHPTRESISTNLPTPALNAGPSADRCTSRPTSPRTVCTTPGELVFGQYRSLTCKYSLFTCNGTAFWVICAHSCEAHTVIPRLTDPLGTWFVCSRVDVFEFLMWYWLSGPHNTEVNWSPSFRQNCVCGKVWLWWAGCWSISFLQASKHTFVGILCIWTPLKNTTHFCTSQYLSSSNPSRKSVMAPILSHWRIQCVLF